ncbi:hypothetical protein [Thomasclavelia ramosa]|uniref:hypothetical protein n=1 Tax=Thomasclavelia ramosa TaxID=1547 RepID=UPI00189D7A8D|nr:hypothetical protein [Thomasclavelia ramosa]
MLQICTGRFYNKSKGIHETNSSGTLFSVCQYSDKIITKYFSLIPRKIENEIYAYDVEFVNRMEAGGILVKVGDFEYINQVKLILTLAFHSYFTDSENELKRIIEQNQDKSESMTRGPYYYTKKIFSPKIIKGTDIDNLINLLNNLIDLKRDYYKKIITALQALHSSVLLLEEDYSLAYSMLIIGMETMATSFDNYKAIWENHDEEERKKLEKVFEDMEEIKVQEIKNILIENDFQKLSYRFRKFVLNTVSDNYYLKSAANVINPIQQIDLESALQNAYIIRSKYAHQLKKVIKNLEATPDVDSTRIFGRIYLTYYGLIRLYVDLICSIIKSSEHVETENYDWKNDLPGMLDIELEPSMWITQCTNLNDKKIKYWANKVIDIMHSKKNIYDIRDVLRYLISDFNTKNIQNKRAILCIYYLYNSIVQEKFRLEDYERFILQNKTLLENPCIETFVLSLFINVEENLNLNQYNVDILEEILIEYQNKKNKINRHGNNIGYCFSQLLEAKLYLLLMNEYFIEKNTDKFKEWGYVLMYNLTGYYEIQKEIDSQIKENTFSFDKLYDLLDN